MATAPLSQNNFSKIIVDWYIKYGRRFPWRQPGNITPYRILVTEILLQRTKASTVAKLWNYFFELFPTVSDLANTSHEKVKIIVEKLGFRKRAGILVDAARYVVKEFGGTIPEDYHTLLLIPGVGPYVASATLCFGFERPFPVVDVNVLRMFNRLLGLTVETDIRKVLENLIPPHSPREFCWGLLDIASIYCGPRQTDCEKCPISKYCSKEPLRIEEWRVLRKRVVGNKAVLTLQRFVMKK